MGRPRKNKEISQVYAFRACPKKVLKLKKQLAAKGISFTDFINNLLFGAPVK